MTKLNSRSSSFSSAKILIRPAAILLFLFLTKWSAASTPASGAAASLDEGDRDATTRSRDDRIGVGFGTAALGSNCRDVVITALEYGFRRFDTAEADWWYDQRAVGRALRDYFSSSSSEGGDDDKKDVCQAGGEGGEICVEANVCAKNDLRISTKIPPWSLTDADTIRSNAANSREELVGFCDGESAPPFPLDVYFIHAPSCWRGWHPRCDDAAPAMHLLDVWEAMEAVVGTDGSARRIGLSNVSPQQLLDVIEHVQTRQQQGQEQREQNPPPRMPDAVQAYADPTHPADELRRICQEHSIEFVSYSTLGTQHRQATGRNPVLDSPVVLDLAKKHDRSNAEVVLSWALQKGMSVIPRSSKEHHIQQLSTLLTWNDDESPSEMKGFLTEQDIELIDSMKNTF